MNIGNAQTVPAVRITTSPLMLDSTADPGKLVSMLHYNGLPISAEFIVERVVEEMARGQAA